MIKQFLDYLQLERKYSHRTVESYDEDLRSLEDFFKAKDSKLSWQTIDSDIIRCWMENLMDKGNTAATINRRLSGVRSFFRYALRKGLVSKDPSHLIVGPKKHKSLPAFVKEGEIDKLLLPEMWTDSYDDVLARTLFILLYETGLRRAEVTGLNITNWDRSARELNVTGKGNKQRRIPYGKELEDALNTYMKRREEVAQDGEQALFVTSKGVRMKGDQVSYIVKKHLTRVTTMKKRSPHVLRHSFATAMLNHNAGLESVRKLLGHESVKTTEIYTHVTFEQMKKVYEAAHPRHIDNNL